MKAAVLFQGYCTFIKRKTHALYNGIKSCLALGKISKL